MTQPLRLSEVVSKRILGWCAARLREGAGFVARAANEIDKAAEATIVKASCWNEGYRQALKDAEGNFGLLRSQNPYSLECETIAEAQLRLGIIGEREFRRIGLECLAPNWEWDERDQDGNRAEASKLTTLAAWKKAKNG